MKPKQRALTFIILFTLVLSACAIFNPDTPSTPEPQATATAIPEQVPTEGSLPQIETLVLWIAPPFHPDTEAGQLLADRLAAFEQRNTGVRVQARVKPQSGPGGILQALQAATIAAPTVAPDLITLTPDDLELAAQSDLIISLPEDLISAADPGWYDYALPQTRIDGVFYGIPFASDLEILAFRRDLYSEPPRSWEVLLSEPKTFLFPAADPRARFLMAMYLGAGGSLTNENGDPSLDLAITEQILGFLSDGRSSSVIPVAVRQYSSPLETWTELKANRSASAMTPLADYFREGDPERLGATPLPTINGQGSGLASSWSWSVTNAGENRQALILELLAWLIDPAFQGEFTYALGLLPTSQEVLATWPEDDRSALASSLVTVTRAEPSQDLRDTIAATLLTAAESVLGADTDPVIAAQDAIEQLTSP